MLFLVFTDDDDAEAGLVLETVDAGRIISQRRESFVL